MAPPLLTARADYAEDPAYICDSSVLSLPGGRHPLPAAEVALSGAGPANSVALRLMHKLTFERDDRDRAMFCMPHMQSMTRSREGASFVLFCR